jgi:hypothetical protein
VVAIDLRTNQIVRTYDFRFAFPPVCQIMACSTDFGLTLAVDHGLWVGSTAGIERLDLTTGQASLGHSEWQFLAYSPGRIWVAILQREGSSERAIQALNPSTGKATADPGSHYVDATAWVHVCSAMVVAEQQSWEDGSTSLHLLTPTTDAPSWPVRPAAESNQALDAVGQADGGCWASIGSPNGYDAESVHLAHLTIDGIEYATDAIFRDGDTGSVRVRFYDGKAWLVRVTPQGTYVQRLELPSLRLLDRPMRVPAKWLGIAGGSIWARNAQGYLVRLALNGATPGPRTPAPKPTLGATPTPAPTAGASS